MNKLLIGCAAILMVASAIIGTNLIAKHNDAVTSDQRLANANAERIELLNEETRRKINAEEAYRKATAEKCQRLFQMSKDEFVRFFGGMLREDAKRILSGCGVFD
jgi:hypothetical protein